MAIALGFALMGGVNPLKLPVQKRITSRVVFYILVFFVFWVVGMTQPSQSQIEEQRDQELGVAKAYYGHPIDPTILSASR